MTTVVITGPVFTHDDFEEAEELIYFGLDKTTLLTTGNHISCYGRAYNFRHRLGEEFF